MDDSLRINHRNIKIADLYQNHWLSNMIHCAASNTSRVTWFCCMMKYWRSVMQLKIYLI